LILELHLAVLLGLLDVYTPAEELELFSAQLARAYDALTTRALQGA